MSSYKSAAMNSTALEPGRYCGRTIRSLQSGGFILSETDYRRGLRLPRHSHQNAYFCLIREGGYSETYSGRVRECRASSVVFHPPGEVHDENFHSRVLSFNVEFHRGQVDQLDRNRLFSDCAEVSGGRVVALILQLYREFRITDPFSDLAIQGLIFEILAETGRACASNRSRRLPAWLSKAKEMLHESYAEGPTLEEVARAAGVHPVHLATEFRKAFRVTVGEYLRRLRVEYSSRELIASTRPLVDIGLDAGFSDQSHFTRTFKRVTGLTPAAYRALHRRP